MSNNFDNEVRDTIQFLAERNKYEGFSLRPYTYIKQEYHEGTDVSLSIMEVRAEGVEILFRLKNPNGKIIAKTVKTNPIMDENGNDTGKAAYCLAEAYVYLDYKDPEEHFVVREIASAVYDEVHPEINVEVAAHTFAKLKALKKLGYGAEYGFEAKYYPDCYQQEKQEESQYPAFSPEESAYQQSLIDLDPEFKKLLIQDKKDIAQEQTSENKLDKAFKVVCQSEGMEGLTLKEIYDKFPKYLTYMTSNASFIKDPKNKEAYEAALYILEHTKK